MTAREAKRRVGGRRLAADAVGRGASAASEVSLLVADAAAGMAAVAHQLADVREGGCAIGRFADAPLWPPSNDFGRVARQKRQKKWKGTRGTFGVSTNAASSRLGKSTIRRLSDGVAAHQATYWRVGRIGGCGGG